jgi:hypothetical protein
LSTPLYLKFLPFLFSSSFPFFLSFSISPLVVFYLFLLTPVTFIYPSSLPPPPLGRTPRLSVAALLLHPLTGPPTQPPLGPRGLGASGCASGGTESVDPQYSTASPIQILLGQRMHPPFHHTKSSIFARKVPHSDAACRKSVPRWSQDL